MSRKILLSPTSSSSQTICNSQLQSKILLAVCTYQWVALLPPGFRPRVRESRRRERSGWPRVVSLAPRPWRSRVAQLQACARDLADTSSPRLGSHVLFAGMCHPIWYARVVLSCVHFFLDSFHDYIDGNIILPLQMELHRTMFSVHSSGVRPFLLLRENRTPTFHNTQLKKYTYL